MYPKVRQKTSASSHPSRGSTNLGRTPRHPQQRLQFQRMWLAWVPCGLNTYHLQHAERSEWRMSTNQWARWLKQARRVGDGRAQPVQSLVSATKGQRESRIYWGQRVSERRKQRKNEPFTRYSILDGTSSPRRLWHPLRKEPCLPPRSIHRACT